MTKVFISHSTVDRRFVEAQLLPLLQAVGATPWYSRKDISSAQEWENSIRDGLFAANWLVVVISAASSRSAWVKAEVDWALEHRTGKVLPLCVDHTQPEKLHLRLRLVQSLDWTRSPAQAKLAISNLLLSDADGSSSAFKAPESDHDLPDQYARPQVWHCVFCGWKCDNTNNDYLCAHCSKHRPFAGGTATMIRCSACLGWSIVLASYCEWCGDPMQ
ncbi:toll/interleukin-1 receptor domain-containing protein [Sphaerotilus montanus]|uniref:toll/interleukin-1 receptor domain-containing protein n=1 Tax=Sphaerotilus montanus TaxID=522889 RepID=UPI003FA33B6D